MNHKKIVRWIESPHHGYSKTDRVPRWQAALLWLTKPYRGWFWKQYFSNGVAIVAAKRR